jgi:hypothetical protein
MICSEKALGPFAATCIGAVPYASVLSRDLSRLSREAGYLCSIQASRLADLHFLPHTRAHDAIRPRTAFERDVPKSPSDQRAGRWPLLARSVRCHSLEAICRAAGRRCSSHGGNACRITGPVRCPSVTGSEARSPPWLEIPRPDGSSHGRALPRRAARWWRKTCRRALYASFAGSRATGRREVES